VNKSVQDALIQQTLHTFSIIVPRDDLDDVGLDCVDCLLPAVLDEGVTELDPAIAAYIFELPWRDSCV
jgi:hypothetical protein